MGARLTGLDAMRGLAALIVLIFHTSRVYKGYDPFPTGYLAVDFFFTLSGYVMARTYETRLHQGWTLPFLKARVKRLWPMMVIGGMIGLPILALNIGWWAVPVAALNLAFIPVFYKKEIFPLNGPYWSLFYELVANITHALLLHRASNRQLAAIVIALGGVFAYLGWLNGGISFGTMPQTFWQGFVRVHFSYLLGVLLYRLWQDQPPIPVPAWLALLIMPIALAFPLHWALQLGFVAVLVPLMIAGGLSFAAGRIGAWLGAISFPLYVLHLPLLKYGAVMQLHPLIAMGAVLAATTLITMVFERKRLRRQKPPIRVD